MSILLFSSSILPAQSEPAVAHHPLPKEPIYVASSWYEVVKKALPALPVEGGQDYLHDHKILRELQASRTEAECKAARSEVMVNLGSFYAQPHGPLNPQQTGALAPFFEQTRNDADYFIQRLKKEFPRERPFLYMKDLSPCVPHEVTGAYPSGHAVLSHLFALMLVDFGLGEAAALDSRAQEISRHRVLSGMHHPTDIDAGRKIAGLLLEQFKKSKRYRDDFEKARSTLATKVPRTPGA